MHVYLVCVCVARHSFDIEKCIKREEPSWPFYVRERSKGGDVRCRATVCKSNSALFLDLTQRNLLSYSLGSSHFSVPLWTTKRATCDAARRVASTSSVKNMRKIIYVTATESRIQTTIRRVARSRASARRMISEFRIFRIECRCGEKFLALLHSKSETSDSI